MMNKKEKEVKQEITGNNNIQVGGDYINTNKIQKKYEAIPDYNVHISESQAKQIKDKVDELVICLSAKGDVGKHYQNTWTMFKNRYNITQYKFLPKEKFDEAIKFLQQHIAINRPKLRKHNNDEYKKQYYSAIWAKAGEHSMGKQDVYDYAEKVLQLKKPISSLKELSDTRLKKLHTKIFGI